MCLMSCVAECSDGGNSYMGTAHSDPSQGKCLQLFKPLSLYFSFVFVPSLPVCGILKMHFVVCVRQFFLPVPLSIRLFSLSVLRGPAVAAGCAVLKQ